MSLDLLLEAALFVEQQQSQPLRGEEPKLLNGHHLHNGYEHPHVASVIQRLPPSANGAGAPLSLQRKNSRSPSPTRNGYSPKMSQEQVQVIPEQQPCNYRVDDVASRSHRLEEALLRASRNKSPTIISQYPAGTSSGRTSADELSEFKKRTGAGTREVHNKLEKNRRAHLRECFEFLRKQLPAVDDKKLSNLGILKSALRFIQTLKRKEREYEHTMERLAREKIAAQQRLASLRKEVSILPGYSGMIPATLEIELEGLEQEEESSLTLANVAAHTIRTTTDYGIDLRQEADGESNSGTSTASERGDYMSGDEGDKGLSTFPPESYSHAQLVHVVRPVAQHATNSRMPEEEAQQQIRPVSYNIKYVRPIVSNSSSITTTCLAVLPDDSSGSPGGGQLYHQSIAFASNSCSAAHSQQPTATLKVLTQAGQPGTTSLRLVTAADGVSTSLQSLVTTSGGKMSEGEGFCIPAGVVIPSLVAIPASGSESEPSSLPSSAVSSGYDPTRTSTCSPHLIKSNSPTVLSLPNGVFQTSRTLQTSTTGVTHAITPIAVTRSLPPGHLMTGMTVMGQPTHFLTGTLLGKLKPGTFPVGGIRGPVRPLVVVSAPTPTSSSSIISVTTASSSNLGSKYPPNC